MVKKIWEIIKRYWRELVFLIIVVSIAFIGLTRVLFFILPGEIIGEKSNWVSFSGSYIAVIGAVGAVWLQIKKEKEQRIAEKEKKENDKILNLLNEVIFFSNKDNFENSIKETKKLFSLNYDLYVSEKKDGIIIGNWRKFLEEDRKILFSNKLDPFFFETISKIDRINSDYFIFLEKRKYIDKIYVKLYSSKNTFLSELHIITTISSYFWGDIDLVKEDIFKDIEKKEFKEVFENYSFDNQNLFSKVELYLKLIGLLYGDVLEKDDSLKEELKNNIEQFRDSIEFLKEFSKRIIEVEKSLDKMHKKAKHLKTELEK